MSRGPKGQKSLADVRIDKDPAAVALGRRGGKARAEALSKKRRTEIARDAAEKRWKSAARER
jgi:hypothetical protein